MPSSSVSTQAAAPPPTLLLFNGLLILAFLSVPFLALRLLFLLPPLRPPPPPRKRPGGASPLLSTAPDSTTTADEDDNDDDDDDDDDEALTAYNASPTRLLVVLGSGGHTAEMLAMLRKLDAQTFLRSWTHRTYVVSEGDALSASRARDFEDELHAVACKHSGSTTAKDDQQQLAQGAYDIRVVPRARRVHQSLLTTPFSALRCLAACFSIIRSPALGPSSTTATTTTYPDLILTNGPGTAVIVVLAALLLRFADVGDARGTSRVRTVYVESWARVRRLSLSGRLLLRVVDRFVVQWEELVGQTAGRGEYLGVLV